MGRLRPVSSLAYAVQIAGMTYSDLARSLGVTRQAVQYWAAGKRKVPKTMAQKICEILSEKLGEPIDVSALFDSNPGWTRMMVLPTEQDGEPPCPTNQSS